MDDYWKTDLKRIKEWYVLLWPELKKKYPRWDPYPIVSLINFTPIEKNVWEDIRKYNIPLLPQFPSSGYFLDFADPFKRIVVEVDGKDYHLDKERDEKRDAILRKKGWNIFRITGSETYFR